MFAYQFIVTHVSQFLHLEDVLLLCLTSRKVREQVRIAPKRPSFTLWLQWEREFDLLIRNFHLAYPIHGSTYRRFGTILNSSSMVLGSGEAFQHLQSLNLFSSTEILALPRTLKHLVFWPFVIGNVTIPPPYRVAIESIHFKGYSGIEELMQYISTDALQSIRFGRYPLLDEERSRILEDLMQPLLCKVKTIDFHDCPLWLVGTYPNVQHLYHKFPYPEDVLIKRFPNGKSHHQ